ncbi:hypothetical protein BO70DRAFT_374676 [Aspergillus heteromorphus CBS 117.55]|uniref:Uncharacterized protein n=1 Tax=Aspergillus heteromorphus CBS 117.55 TaxID=1448321 RepID=A0A317V0Z5_9EURO|nr:uncharacterized protein BO70DRAFT_374676 [Aspergillus heteromorphus CBS 117.55]PWY66748.1 hypothetical protein BO70DRAFT_374676 [Aspergillus heteromorphus CBS 117.55]
MPFIISTGTKKVDPHTRKLIRSHVTRGKNRGKARVEQPSQQAPHTHDTHAGITNEHEEQIKMHQARVGFFPLARCVVFNKVDSHWMLRMLSSNDAYVNAVIMTAQLYFEKDDKGSASPYLNRTIRLLRDKLSDEQSHLSNATITAMSLLAMHAHMTGDMNGLKAFMSISRLPINLIRCDIGRALLVGDKPVFGEYRELGPSILFPPYLKMSLISEPPFVQDLDPGLAGIWRTMQTFSAYMNLASETSGRIPEIDFVRTMLSVMYPLQRMVFENGSCDEAVRLALLAYGFDVFLRWDDCFIHSPYLSAAYERCLVQLRTKDYVSSQLWIWLLTVGNLSVFLPPAWNSLKHWLLDDLKHCKIHSWKETQAILSSFI